MVPLRRETPFYRTFYITSPETSSYPQSPRQGSPLHVSRPGPYGERYSFTRATGLSIHVYLPGSSLPKRSPPTKWGKHTVTLHVAQLRRKAYIEWGAAWFPRGSLTTLLSVTQCHAAVDKIPSTLAWVDQALVSQRVS